MRYKTVNTQDGIIFSWYGSEVSADDITLFRGNGIEHELDTCFSIDGEQ